MATDSETICLHHISELPFDAQSEFFQHYPGFKLGVTDSVRDWSATVPVAVRVKDASEDACAPDLHDRANR